MKFTILSPTQSKVFEVDWLEAQTEQGSLIIQQGHAPTILSIPENKELLVGLTDGSTTAMTIPGGILEVQRDSLLLLLTHD